MGAEGVQLPPALQIGMKLDLVDRRLYIGLELQLFQVLQLEIGDADGLCLALLLQINELLPSLNICLLYTSDAADE